MTRPASSGPVEDPGAEYGQLQLITLEGWRGFVTEIHTAPDLLPRHIWTGLAEDERSCYDDDRIDHHSRLLMVQTPTIRQVITAGPCF
ncbi:hypothetical protein SAMN05216215_101899 [Saccharopolyspora shandongensis]|uniref:Uncharacterized protein n=1 Tax=Saccharopolyspora shandongensis TaxID=418495 RepID=A0A1H3G9U0_9PSEU|nr:hypothetical protein [Saccharopolyspora shandongensis]SDY00046.1 hypothetical protein SAMN05216215_101899 [Saccharopolyspora shandongensis]